MQLSQGPEAKLSKMEMSTLSDTHSTMQAPPSESGHWLDRIDQHAMARWLMVATTTQPLPDIAHAGSMLRGCFGHALRKLACRCTGDEHAADCIYAAIFEPSSPVGLGTRYGTVPPAFVITPPGPIAKGARSFPFWLTLFGPALHHVDLMLAAWRLAGRVGFDPGHIRGDIVRLATEAVPATTPIRSQCTLELASPLFIKHKGAAMAAPQLTPRDILVALTRRMTLLDKLYDILPPGANPGTWPTCADHLQLTAHGGQARYQRYSHRQRHAMPLQGMVGNITLCGDFPAGLTDALTLGQWLHIGGKAAFGMGAYRLRVPRQGRSVLSLKSRSPPSQACHAIVSTTS